MRTTYSMTELIEKCNKFLAEYEAEDTLAGELWHKAFALEKEVNQLKAAAERAGARSRNLKGVYESLKDELQEELQI